MAELVWDAVGEKLFETGTDRAVLYLPDGKAVPWNGLTSVVETLDSESSPVYFDGRKIQDLVVLGDFSATLRALTFPEEFAELEGAEAPRYGFFVGEQPPQTFGLSYRTKIGNDLEGNDKGYKLHILYNVTAIPSEREYTSISEEPTPTEFEWQLLAVPEEVLGMRPTAHITIDSNNIDPWLFEDLQRILQGGEFSVPTLPPIQELIDYIREWYRFKIIDNGDGTITLISPSGNAFQYDEVQEGLVKLVGVNALFLDNNTFQLSDVYDIRDILRMRITDNGDGTWTAVGHDDDISVNAEGEFEITNANAVYLNQHTYRVSSAIQNS